MDIRAKRRLNVLPETLKSFWLTNRITFPFKNDILKDDDGVLDENDPYHIHFQNDFGVDLILPLRNSFYQEIKLSWPILGQLKFYKPKTLESNNDAQLLTESQLLSIKELSYATVRDPPICGASWSDLFIKKQILCNIESHIENALTKELFLLANNYHDVYYPEQTLKKSRSVRMAYCIHAVNHVLKSVLKVHKNDLKMNGVQFNISENVEQMKDQGFSKLKVLILVPFKKIGISITRIIADILLGKDKYRWHNNIWKLFTEDNVKEPPNRPCDYQATFRGNISDYFYINLSINNNGLTVFSLPFDTDIMITTPLVLSKTLGPDVNLYTHFASIEMLIMEQAHVFTMQNWEHVLVFLKSLSKPVKPKHVDVNRLRTWNAKGFTQYYMQSLIFSEHFLPDISAMFFKRCNYAGKVIVDNPILKSIKPHPQRPSSKEMFYYVSSESLKSSVLQRFETFKSLLPKFKDEDSIIILFPSYFDFVKVRHHFQFFRFEFCSISEYDTQKETVYKKKIAQFVDGNTKYLLFTERCYFFYRYKLPLCNHVVFYQPPLFPKFYKQFCKCLIRQKGLPFWDTVKKSSHLLFSKYDCRQLEAIFGTKRAVEMLSSRF